MKAEATPWRAWLAAAVALGVAPNLFWRLSLREWRALAAPPQSQTLDRASFETLAAQHPDEHS